MTNATTNNQVTMSVTKAHDMLGHPNEEATREIVKALNWEITRGSPGMCEPCTEATKAKQKNLPRD